MYLDTSTAPATPPDTSAAPPVPVATPQALVPLVPPTTPQPATPATPAALQDPASTPQDPSQSAPVVVPPQAPPATTPPVTPPTNLGPTSTTPPVVTTPTGSGATPTTPPQDPSSTSTPIDIISDPTVIDDAQNAFAAALLAETGRWVGIVVQEDHALPPPTQDPGSSAGGPALPAGVDVSNPFLAAKPKPLSDAELTKLEGLVSKGKGIAKADEPIRDDLIKRLGSAGVKFDGLDSLAVLDRLLQAGQKGLAGDPRKLFLGAYRDMLKVAIGGLQKIDDAKYAGYKAAREGGASHDDAWTWMYNGDTALRRYTLEKLIEKAASAK